MSGCLLPAGEDVPDAKPPVDTGSGGGDVPESWSCDPDYYDGNDGCDCKCGAVDPDCARTPDDVYGCGLGGACDAAGQCVLACPELEVGSLCSDDGHEARMCVFDGAEFTVVSEHCEEGSSCAEYDGYAYCAVPAPDGWTCPPDFYGTNDGCDCECGIFDPDCFSGTEEVIGCELGEVCGSDGTCQPDCPELPPGGACDGDTALRCQEGVVVGEACGEDEHCKIAGNGASLCVAAGSPAQTPPGAWTCSPETYAAGDGCDCSCGVSARDPDCEDEAQTLYGCRDGQQCDQQGLCRNPPPPEPVCGDRRCNGEDTPETCPEDCLPMPQVPGADTTGLPDLTIDPHDLESSLYLDTIDVQAGSCLTDEAQLCVTGTGLRRVLRFTTTIGNVGTADHVVGDPEHVYDPNWYWDTCHSHHHYRAYAAYDLLDADGSVVVQGAKQGFLVIDTGEVDARCDPKFEVSVFEGGTWFSIQGISVGCSDTYDASLPCQWIDVTDVPDGPYELVVRANPDQTFEELDYENNASSVRIELVDGGVTVIE